MNTYTATFSDGTTATKSTKSAKGFKFAVQVTTTNGKTTSFSATQAGALRVVRDFQEIGELVSHELVEATKA